jgi:hypothetical protein
MRQSLSNWQRLCDDKCSLEHNQKMQELQWPYLREIPLEDESELSEEGSTAAAGVLSLELVSEEDSTAAAGGCELADASKKKNANEHVQQHAHAINQHYNNAWVQRIAHSSDKLFASQ